MSGDKNIAVTGIFTYLDDLLRAIREAKTQEWDHVVYSPVPNHHIEELCFREKSPVRIFTLIGAISGLCFGFALTIWCSLDMPLRVSAKPIVSIPAFVPIGYECTILFGALMTFFAVFMFCKLPNVFRKIGYDPRFSDDKFGLVISCENNDAEAISAELLRLGADEVNVKDAL